MFSRTVRFSKALTATTGLLLLLAAAPALAAGPSHSLLFSLAIVKTPLNPPLLPEAELSDACGVAVDSAGHIYVSDYYHHAVDVFNPSLGYEKAIALEDPLDGPCGLAVDSSGDIYVNNYHRNVVKYVPTGGSPPYSLAGVIDSAHPTAVAVDPASGNVYVDDRTYVAVYEPSGAPLLDAEGHPVQIGAGSLADGYGVAVSDFPATSGYVYVADAATDTVKAYDPAAPTVPAAVIDGAGTPQSGFSSLRDSSLAVDQTDGHLYVADNLQPDDYEHPQAAVDEFNAAGAYRGQLPHPIVDGEPTGVAVDGAGNVYATSGNWESATLYAFGPTAPGQTLAVSNAGAGQGVVTSAPAGTLCGTACAAEYDRGETVTLTATPDPSSNFAGWTGCAIESGEECTVTMGADKTVSAEFEVAPQPLLSLEGTGAGKAAAASAPALATTTSSPGPPALHSPAKRRHHRHHHKGRGLKVKRGSH